MLDLADTQRLFWDAVVARKTVGRAELDQVFVGDARLGAVERLAIYAGMYVRRLTEALAVEFPAVKAVVGEEAFETLAQAYIERYPSEHHSIAHIGRELMPFLRTVRRRPLTRAHPALARPDLSALADLERRRSLAFDTRDVDPAPFSALASLPADRLPEALLTPVPSVSVATYRYQVTALWRAAVDAEARAEIPRVNEGREHVLVYRQGFTVRSRSVSPQAASALRALIRGDRLEGICAAFSRDADPMASAIACMQEWFALGLVADVSVESSR